MFFVRSLDGFEEAATGPQLVAHLTFEGDRPGSLALRVAQPAARSIAADFLGADESELSDREVGEVICELANMICGSVLSRVESNTAFRLSTPRIVAAGEVPGPAGTARGGSAQVAEISHGVMVVSIQTEAPACPTATEFAF